MSQDKANWPENEPQPTATETPANTMDNATDNATEGATGSTADITATGDAELQTPERIDAEAEVVDADAAEQDDVETLRQALLQTTAEAERLKDQALRATAEADNTRKRAQRDVEAARKFALEKFARELLGVRDSLDMGLQAAAEDNADLAGVIEGMELTGRMLATAMEKFGVEVVNPQGDAFDPELHEAVSMQETDAQAPNSVVSVIQKGYTLNGRVLRAAMVVVAQAPSGKA